MGCLGSKEPKAEPAKPKAQPDAKGGGDGKKKPEGEAKPKKAEIINPITPGKVEDFYEFGKEIGKYVFLSPPPSSSRIHKKKNTKQDVKTTSVCVRGVQLRSLFSVGEGFQWYT